MKPYYPEDKKGVTGNTEQVMRKLLNRYIKANPEETLYYRAYTDDGLRRERSGVFAVDFNQIFPEAEFGDYAYAYAQYNVDGYDPHFHFGAQDETVVYVNGEKVTKTDIFTELLEEDKLVHIPSKPGYNTIMIKCKKGSLGFGFRFGAMNHKGNGIEFYKAFAENAGELGWNYCGPFREDIYKEPLSGNPSMEAHWYPQPYEAKMPSFPGHTEMYVVSTLVCDKDGEVSFCAEAAADMELYIDGTISGQGKDKLCVKLNLTKGTHAVSVRLFNKAENTTFAASAEGAVLALPDCTRDVKGQWLYLDSADERAKAGFDKYQLYDGYAGEKTYYMCGENTYLRPIIESRQFGRLTYPNGVVMYGLLEAGNYLQDEDVLEYAHAHIQTCYGPLELALWEREKFGWACVDHKLMDITFLDDCGSFSAMVLEDYLKYHKDEKIKFYAEFIADYILNQQERLENGMFYRIAEGKYQQQTIWADDIYMSTPFMMRYAQMTGKSEVIEDVVNQFLCYKEKLYMPEHKLLGHVYSLRHQKCTRVPWGRGNGWVLFSLTELLAILPKDHEKYEEIKTFFLQLAEGFMNNIDEEGIIHQVIWDHDSFEEASGTAMCAAAFARGVRMGLLPAAPYKEASERSAETLKKYCIDEEGNIYGVCRGSGYSFRLDYYKHDLACVTNDTHGTGIVLIALLEVEKNRNL